MDRAMTEQEKLHRRLQRKADKKNAKAQASHEQAKASAPLFAEQIEPPSTIRTANDEYWHWRRNMAKHMGEGVSTFQGGQLLDLLRETVIRRYVRTLVGDEAFTKLDAYRWHTYPKHDYGYGFWLKVLTGGRVEFAIRKGDREKGEPMTVAMDWYEHRHMSDAEYYAMFPYKDEPIPQGDDGGLAEKIDAILRTVSATL